MENGNTAHSVAHTWNWPTFGASRGFCNFNYKRSTIAHFWIPNWQISRTKFLCILTWLCNGQKLEMHRMKTKPTAKKIVWSKWFLTSGPFWSWKVFNLLKWVYVQIWSIHMLAYGFLSKSAYPRAPDMHLHPTNQKNIFHSLSLFTRHSWCLSSSNP